MCYHLNHVNKPLSWYSVWFCTWVHWGTELVHGGARIWTQTFSFQRPYTYLYLIARLYCFSSEEINEYYMLDNNWKICKCQGYANMSASFGNSYVQDLHLHILYLYLFQTHHGMSIKNLCTRHMWSLCTRGVWMSYQARYHLRTIMLTSKTKTLPYHRGDQTNDGRV